MPQQDQSTFDPDAFHQSFVQSGGGTTSFDPDEFHAQYTGSPSTAPSAQPPGQEVEGTNLETAPLKVLKGAAKGIGSTAYGLTDMANKGIRGALNPFGNPVAGSVANKLVPAMPPKPAGLAPQGALEDTGYVGEQIGEGMIPGLGEEDAGVLAGKALPALGEAAPKLGRVAYDTLTQGLTNKAQGGSFKQGAVLGAGGSVAGEIGRGAAPSLAEGALDITKKQRGYGRTPGVAALEEVGGVRPETIAANAEKQLGDLMAQLEHAAQKSTVPANTKSALQVLTDEANKARAKNDLTTFNNLNQIRKQLTTDAFTGQPIPQQLQARQLLNLKRGIGNLVTNWNPEVRRSVQPVLRRVYGALDSELDRTVPESAELNQRISSLIPVAQRARSTEIGAEIPQRMAHRMAAHTGALASAGLGGAMGYEHGGTPGALAGSVAGLAVPEVLSSPTVQMSIARALRSPMTARIARAGAGQLLPRQPLDDEEPDEKK